jgi:hypothetical protein
MPHLLVFQFLGAFAKLRKATVGFVMSVCLSVCPSVRPSVLLHGTTEPPLDGFSPILCWGKSLDVSTKFRLPLYQTKVTGMLLGPLRAFMSLFFIV